MELSSTGWHLFDARESLWKCADCKEVCMRCGRVMTADSQNWQALGKNASSWRCPPCNVNGVRLNRIRGSWPPDGFSFNDDEEHKFWAHHGELGSAKEVEKYVLAMMVKRRSQMEEAGAYGQYQPLKFWEIKGYDPQRFKDTTAEENIREHPHWGQHIG